MSYISFILPTIIIFGLYLSSTNNYSYILIYSCFQHCVNIIPDFVITDKLLIKSILSGTISSVSNYLIFIFSSPIQSQLYSMMIISFILNFLLSLSTHKYNLTEIFLTRTLFNIFLYK